VIEEGVLVFHPENIALGDDVYVGHRTILKGYHKGRMVIGRGTWIGQDCFFHSAGDIVIGENVGIGPCVKILTSAHRLDELDKPILHAAIDFAPVHIGDGADIGVGAILLPGVTIGSGAQIGAGAVVSSDIPPMAIASGVPARVMRLRTSP
jgi:acetyltransferase-like isoleucine patch superfamily enzyme